MKPTVYKKFKSQAEKVVWITLFWVIISIFQFLTSYSALINFNCIQSGPRIMPFLHGSIITGLTAGIIGGSSIVIFWENWLRTKSYGIALLHLIWSYTLVFSIVAIVGGLFFKSKQLGLPIFSQDTWEAAWLHHTSFTQIHNYLFWLFVVFFTLIGLLVNDKYGPGVFKSFILGKYFKPSREERIFMFLDLRGSTSIAEKLGEEHYFYFLKDLFKDATPAILHSKGEIYQYVGDEIVISWKKNSGIENANCIQCFFDIQKRILDKKKYYQENYNGIIPQFKAGLHYGAVMVGEIGIVKREIAYSGDVLNTTARIQSKCNELGEDILLSNLLLDKLKPLPNPFKSTALGEIQLRGKQKTLRLYTV